MEILVTKQRLTSQSIVSTFRLPPNDNTIAHVPRFLRAARPCRCRPSGRVRAAHDRRAAARAAVVRARPDDRVDRAADDRRRPGRPREAVVGRHRVPAVVDRRAAAVRQARRSVRAQDRAAGGDRAVRRRLGALRACAGHDAADRAARAAGARRRRADGRHDGGDRRSDSARRARPLPGDVRRRVRDRDRDRAAARRVSRPASVVALDLLHQPAARRARVRGDRRGVQAAHRIRAAPDRLRRRRVPRHRAHLRRAVHEPGRHDPAVVVAATGSRSRSASSRPPASSTRNASPRSRSCRSSCFATAPSCCAA